MRVVISSDCVVVRVDFRGMVDESGDQFGLCCRAC